MISLKNSEYNFSYYENLYAVKKSERELDINELIEIVKYGYLKDIINKLRATTNKKTHSQIKKTDLPAVTLSGIFSERKAQGLEEHSGLIQVDLDDIKNYADIFKQIISDQYTYVAFKSPGGRGIKVVVKINPDETTHLEQFYALEQHYKTEFNLDLDSSCKDLSRCMLLSYDPDLYCNPFSAVFEMCFMPDRIEEPKASYGYSSINLDTFDQEGIVEQLVADVEKNKIDLTSSHEDWIRIGYALSSTLGESGRDYFHRLSVFHPEYDASKCNIQYTNLNKRNNGSITMGTLIYLASLQNIEINYPKKSKPKSVKFPSVKVVKPPFNPEGLGLFELLRKLRAKLAKSKNIPAYLIFKDSTLDEMTKSLPNSQEEFAALNGVSTKKVEQYAAQFLVLIQEFKNHEVIVPVNIEAKEEAKEVLGEQKSTTYHFNEQEEELYEVLREMRLRISRQEDKNAFRVFGNSTLTKIVRYKPKNKKELLEIKGISQKKLEWFGQELLELIAKNI